MYYEFNKILVGFNNRVTSITLSRKLSSLSIPLQLQARSLYRWKRREGSCEEAGEQTHGWLGVRGIRSALMWIPKESISLQESNLYGSWEERIHNIQLWDLHGIFQLRKITCTGKIVGFGNCATLAILGDKLRIHFFFLFKTLQFCTLTKFTIKL